VACLANIVCFFPLQQNPWDDDQSAYLSRATEIQSRGGAGYLFAALLRGEFEESNRHPLYLAFLSIRPEFDAGKVLSSLFGVITLLLATFLIARRHGAAFAGLFAVLLSTNFAFCFFGTRVVSEILVVLFSGIAWLITSPRPADDRSDQSIAESTKRESLRFACVGTMLGLAWLSKATGLLLLIGYLIWLTVEFGLQRRNHGAQPTAMRKWAVATVCVCSAFLAVGAPLLVRNVRRFGNPFHNVNSLLLFADSYGEFDGMLAAGTTTSSAAQDYFATHTVSDVVRRECSGLVWELFIILRSLGPTPLDDSRVLCGAPLALLAIATALAQRRPEHRLLLVWGLLHWVVFAWYVPIAAGERFVLPLLIPILATASDGLVQLWPWEKPRAVRLWAGLWILWLLVWVIATYAGTSQLAPRLS